MKIQTGQGYISLITLLAIWSISAITSLPGLAISPILGDLDKIFPHISDLEIQMLTSAPNLLIIPFVLLSGKITQSKGKIPMLVLGLCIFLACGILYFFAKSIGTLIIISCLLGVGAGLIIPLSTGLIADVFSGEQRTKQLGLSSSITNLTLVFATFIAGWLANFNWHLPFIVYLVPIICLALCKFLTASNMKNNSNTVASPQAASSQAATVSPYIKAGQSINKSLLFGIMMVYFFATYTGMIVTFNLSFVLQSYHLNSEDAGTMISLLFLAIMLPGLFITKVIRVLSDYAIVIGFILITLGLFMIVFFKDIALIAVATFIIGFGYGIIQPMIYNKTVLTANIQKAVLALAFVMSMNYVALVTLPFIADFFETIFNDKTAIFPFLVNAIMSGAITIVAFIFRKRVLFSSEGCLDS